MKLPAPALFLALLTLLALPAAASAECAAASVGYQFDNSTKNTHLSVDKDVACGMIYTSGAQNMLSSLTIVEKPSVGYLEKNGRFGFAYFPKKGYTGKDLFVLKLCGVHNIQGAGCQTIRYEVTVD